MMLVENYLDKSPIHGIGVFARNLVPQGARIWEFTPGFDQVFREEDLARLPRLQQDIIRFYGYVEIGGSAVVLCCDNARHYNFDGRPNSGPGDHKVRGFVSTFALRDILPGEEFTYSVDEDVDADRKLGEPAPG